MAWVTLDVSLCRFSCSQHAGQVWAETSSVVILPSGLDTHGHMHSQFYTRAYLPCPFRNIFNHYIQTRRHIWRHTQLLHIEIHGSSQGQQQTVTYKELHKVRQITTQRHAIIHSMVTPREKHWGTHNYHRDTLTETMFRHITCSFLEDNSYPQKTQLHADTITYRDSDCLYRDTHNYTHIIKQSIHTYTVTVKLHMGYINSRLHRHR